MRASFFFFFFVAILTFDVETAWNFWPQKYIWTKVIFNSFLYVLYYVFILRLKLAMRHF